MSDIIADFTWTPEEWRRMCRAWMRYTKPGRCHRRNAWLAFFFGAGGLIAAVVLSIRDGVAFSQIMLALASCALLGFLYLARMRSPEYVLSRVEVHWSIFTGAGRR